MVVGAAHKKMKVEGRKTEEEEVSAVKPSYATYLSVAGVLHLLKMAEENSFAISAPCPKGPGLPQSRRSVLFSPACMLLSR